MNINELWERIETGGIVNWKNNSYRVRAQEANGDYQKDHFCAEMFNKLHSIIA